MKKLLFTMVFLAAGVTFVSAQTTETNKNDARAILTQAMLSAQGTSPTAAENPTPDESAKEVKAANSSAAASVLGGLMQNRSVPQEKTKTKAKAKRVEEVE